MKRRNLLAALGGVAALGAVGRPGFALAATEAGYAMVYFTESPSGNGANYGLHLAVSTDGLNWTPLNQNNPVATPTAGTKGLRDPFLLRKQNNKFVVLATDLDGTDWSKASAFLHVWDSADLRTFTGYRQIKMHSLPTHAWAPEAFWDASRGEYAVVYSAEQDGHNVLMVNYTKDFVTVSPPEVFFNPGHDAIDGDFVTVGDVHYMYYKNNTETSLLGTKSTSLKPGSFSTYTGPIRPGRGVEAPEIIKSNTANTWYMWGDTWDPNGRFFCWQTSDVASGSWSLLNDRAYTQPLNSKHPGVISITAAELSGATKTWGAPTWNRIKSYNFPDRYVRHFNNVAQIDTYPFDPYQDQMWELVPGLADPAGVSFRSVNFPDRHLRHRDDALVLNSAADAADTFAADATFYRDAGFADSSWTSFRCFNRPDRHIRHFNNVLRTDVITSGSSTADKEDATFRVGF